jgi:SAM-dependent methyltransferase
MPKDSVQRFSDRVDSYARYRPSYPPAVIACLQEEVGLTPQMTVADIGAGTGILTRMLLENGNAVFAVEPNAAMRQAAEADLSSFSGYHSIDGLSDATTLPEASVDLVTAAQAFHWFEPLSTRVEFRRILRAPGSVALIWNDRRDDLTPFMRAYGELLNTHGTDYKQVDHKYVADGPALERFFAPGGFRHFHFPNDQVLDFDGLAGRLASTSYVPAPGEPGHAAMLAQAQALFTRYAEDGLVRIEYETKVFIGQLAPL